MKRIPETMKTGEAAGEAVVLYDGSGVVTGSATQATLTMTDGMLVEADAYTARTILPDGRLLVEGVNGSFHLRGDNFHLAIKGSGLEITIVGEGTAALSGRGRLRQKQPHPELVSFHKRPASATPPCFYPRVAV